jgi:hypothetical protein
MSKRRKEDVDSGRKEDVDRGRKNVANGKVVWVRNSHKKVNRVRPSIDALQTSPPP